MASTSKKKDEELTIEYNTHDEYISGRRPLADWYDYLLDDEKGKQFQLEITHLVHFTDNEIAEKIGLDSNYPDSFSFKPNEFKNNNGKWNLSWWSLVTPKDWGEEIRSHENFGNYIQNTPKEVGQCQFRRSEMFDGECRYGPIGFAISWKDILNEYARNRNVNRDKVQLKKFGTFFYKLELMFVILVCIEGDTPTYYEDGKERQFNLIEKDTVAYKHTETDDSFIWKFFTTTCGFHPKFKTLQRSKEHPTWDHLAFAFYFPDKDAIFEIQPDLCEIKTKPASFVYPSTRTKTQEKWRTDKKPNTDIVAKLEKKIADSLDKKNLDEVTESLAKLPKQVAIAK